MMESAKAPKELQLSGNVGENWRKFRQNFEIYLKAAGLETKPEEVKVAILLNVVGEDAVELFNTFTLTEEEKCSFNKVIQCFENYARPKKNVVVERYIFNSRVQEPGEPFDSFVTDLKKLVKTCEFKEHADSLIRDRIVLGIHDKNLQERMLRVGELSLAQAVEMGKAAEISKLQAETILPGPKLVMSNKKVTLHKEPVNKVSGNAQDVRKVRRRASVEACVPPRRAGTRPTAASARRCASRLTCAGTHCRPRARRGARSGRRCAAWHW